LLIAQKEAQIIEIRNQFELFEYENVISFSNQLLAKKDSLTNKELIEVFTLKGISHYSLGDERTSRACFIEILRIDNRQQLDSEKTSPKIVDLFNQVKNEYLLSVSDNQPGEEEILDSTIQQKVNIFKIENERFKSSIWKSLLLPGWGQINNGDLTNGIILSTAAVLNVSSLIYFIFDTNSKESKYLAEKDELLISAKYNSFNNSYKIRNLLISSLVLIWVYAQLDILFFSEKKYSPISFYIEENKIHNQKSSISFTLHYSF
jgi:hypothetical protein